jgi:hypothetical protein
MQAGGTATGPSPARYCCGRRHVGNRCTSAIGVRSAHAYRLRFVIGRDQRQFDEDGFSFAASVHSASCRGRSSSGRRDEDR